MNPPRLASRTEADQAWIEKTLVERWGATAVVSRGREHDAARTPAVVAWDGETPIGLATYNVEEGELELLTLDVLAPGRGLGSALLSVLVEAARQAGLKRCLVITSNDNLRALAFYQKRGWRLTALHAGVIDEARALNPDIPKVGANGIPIRDELELSLEL